MTRPPRARAGTARSSNTAATRAYAASAEALVLNFMAYGSEILGLEPHERIFRDKAAPYLIRLDPGVGESFPLVSVSMEAFRRRGPGSPTEVMVRALGRLALARTWHRRGTLAPPVGTMHLNAIAKALLEHHGVDGQAFMDATWRPVATFDKYTDTADWQSAGAEPLLLARSPLLQHRGAALPPGLPWTAGYNSGDAVFVEAVELAPEVVLYWRPTRGDEAEIRLPAGLPQTLVTAALGGPLRRLVSHPVLDRFALTIRNAAYHQRTSRITVEGAAPWKRVRLAGGNDDRAEVSAELKALKPARRQLEALIKRMLTIVGNDRDFVHVPWNDDFDLDEEDVGLGIVWGGGEHCPPGIGERRAEMERKCDDGDLYEGWTEDMIQQLDSEQAMFDLHEHG